MKRYGLLLLALLVVTACPPPPVPEPQPVPQPSVYSRNVQLDLIFTDRGAAQTDARAVIDVKNEVDRAVTIDYEGARHYDMTVGDHRDASIQIESGTYRLRVAAPSFGTAEITISVVAGKAYDLRVRPRRSEPR